MIVNCSFTVDNEVGAVYYNDEPLEVAGNIGVYWQEKKVNFKQKLDADGYGYGEINIEGVDTSPDTKAGFIFEQGT